MVTKDKVYFDEEGNFVIEDHELAMKLNLRLLYEGKLVIRVFPWTCQKYKAKHPMDLENGCELPHEHYKDVSLKYIHWARAAGNGMPPGGTCPTPSQLGDLGCGCDIEINTECP